MLSQTNNHKSQSNVSRIFEEHSRNACFKNNLRITLEYCEVMKIFLEVKKFNNCFVGYPVKI